MTLDGAFSHLATFNTDRLCVRQMRLSDAEAVFEFKSDHLVTDLYGQEPHRTIDESRAWLQRRVNDYALRDSIFWVITLKDDDTAIGECCLWNFDPGFKCAEIGYELHSNYWNKGLMGEALSEVLAYGFLEMGLHRIEASPFADNIQSQKLLLKLGFRLEGTLRERNFFHGRFLDQQYYGLLSEEWKDRTSGV
jgi:ribosomal-protein-alanine N-acetyltransferase